MARSFIKKRDDAHGLLQLRVVLAPRASLQYATPARWSVDARGHRGGAWAERETMFMAALSPGFVSRRQLDVGASQVGASGGVSAISAAGFCYPARWCAHAERSATILYIFMLCDP